MGYDDP